MKKKKIIIAGVIIVLMIAVAAGLWANGRQKARQAALTQMTQVETVRVTKQNLIDSISLTGTVQSADAWDVSASAKNVKVLEVNCEAGDYVNAGDVIVVLDSSDLELSLTEAQNKQALSTYQENKSIESAQEDYQEAVTDAEDSYERAVKKQEDAKKDLQEVVGDENLEPNAIKAYESTVETVEDTVKNNERSIADAQDRLEQAQMEHKYSNDSSEQTIESYQEQIDSCTVTAPISGVITAMNVAVGDTYMGEGVSLFSVADNEHFVVSASVDEYDINKISKDMQAAVIVEAAGEEELPAKVSFVSPTTSESNMGSSSYAIEIALDDANTDLRIGMTAKASVVLDAAYDVLTVPYDCVETDEDGNSVLYIDKDGERTALPVTVGMQGDYYVEVSGEGLDENTLVYYSEPMVNAEGGQGTTEDPQIMMMPGGQGAPDGGGRGGNRGGGPGPGGF